MWPTMTLEKITVHVLDLIQGSSHARLAYPTRNEVEEVNKAVAMGVHHEDRGAPIWKFNQRPIYLLQNYQF